MKSRARWLAVSCLAILLWAAAGPRELHGQAAFGGQLNWGTETDFGIGGRILGNIEEANLEVVGSFDLFFPSGPLKAWEFNGNVFYHIHLEEARSILPYVGGGLNIARRKNDVMGPDRTKVGLNLGGGLRFPTSSNVAPFVEARAVVGTFDQAVLTAGLLFGTGGAR